VEEWFANLIDKLMAREPQRRPRNTQVILNRLRKPPLGLDWQKMRLAGAAVPLLAMGVLQLKLSSEQLDPRRFSVTLNTRGFDYFLAGDKAEASQKFNEAIQQNPQNRAAYYNQAWECEAIRDFDCATGKYQIAAKLGMGCCLQSISPFVYLTGKRSNIGFLYEKQGDTASAITAYQEAIKVKESIQDELKIEEFKTSFADEQINVYERLIRLLWQENLYKEAFNYVERARARSFLDQIANGPINFRAGASEKLLQTGEGVLESKSQPSAFNSGTFRTRVYFPIPKQGIPSPTHQTPLC
jgi:tetratricopeptide (TPR) repeat protein